MLVLQAEGVNTRVSSHRECPGALYCRPARDPLWEMLVRSYTHSELAVPDVGYLADFIADIGISLASCIVQLPDSMVVTPLMTLGPSLHCRYDYGAPISEAGDYGQPGIGGLNKFKVPCILACPSCSKAASRGHAFKFVQHGAKAGQAWPSCLGGWPDME